MDLHLRDKHVLIAGGSRGIGRSCVDAFLKEGARVSVISRNQTDLPLSVFHIVADLSDSKQAQHAVITALDEQGRIDVLVNCAGSARKTPPEEVTPEHFRKAMDAKFYTYINVIDPVIKEMAKERTGSIVNVVGLGGKVAVPTHLPGGSANAALMLATAGYASVYIKKGIRINAVNPIATDTDLLQSSLEADAKINNITVEEARILANAKTPLGRIIRPAEVADSVLFLSSARSSYINGTMLYLDGGMYPFI
jgi:NAD(P)-dependent dehydrogenase (short-subunit alcohol dehydrogenase family)